MTCRAQKHVISGYLDDLLSPRQKAALLAHLSDCPSCAATLARYRQMGVMLRRLPDSPPDSDLRDRVVRGLVRRPLLSLPGSLGGVAAAFAALSFAIAVLVSGSGPLRTTQPESAIAQSAASSEDGTPLLSVFPGQYSAPVAVLPVSPAGPAASPVEDARLLQLVRRSVEGPGFRPFVPGYLPHGLRLNAVNFWRGRPSGPIDRMDVAFAAEGKELRVRQALAMAAEEQAREVQQWRPAMRVIVAGRQWLYLLRNTGRPDDHTGALVGQRGGITIWLESSLPVEELARIAGSLQD